MAAPKKNANAQKWTEGPRTILPAANKEGREEPEESILGQDTQEAGPV